MEKKPFYNDDRFVFVIRILLVGSFLYMGWYCNKAQRECPFSIKKPDGSLMTTQEAQDIIAMYEILKANPQIEINFTNPEFSKQEQQGKIPQ